MLLLDGSLEGIDNLAILPFGLTRYVFPFLAVFVKVLMRALSKISRRRERQENEKERYALRLFRQS